MKPTALSSASQEEELKRVLDAWTNGNVLVPQWCHLVGFLGSGTNDLMLYWGLGGEQQSRQEMFQESTWSRPAELTRRKPVVSVIASIQTFILWNTTGVTSIRVPQLTSKLFDFKKWFTCLGSLLPLPCTFGKHNYWEVEKGTKNQVSVLQDQAKQCPDRIPQLSLLDHLRIAQQDLREWWITDTEINYEFVLRRDPALRFHCHWS